MPLDESLAWYWASIGFSAAGVLVFLWLMREDGRESGIGNRESKEPMPAPSEPETPAGPGNR